MAKSKNGKHIGPPIQFTPEVIEELRQEFWHYLFDEDDKGNFKTLVPSVTDFAVKHKTHKQRIYEIPELREMAELCKSRKENALEQGALNGTLNVSMAIFSLKQLGWTDKNELELSGKRPIVFDPVENDGPNSTAK